MNIHAHPFVDVQQVCCDLLLLSRTAERSLELQLRLRDRYLADVDAGAMVVLCAAGPAGLTFRAEPSTAMRQLLLEVRRGDFDE